MQPHEITPGIWVFTSSLYETTCTVVRTPGGILVIDPNWLPEEISAIRNFVVEKAQGDPLSLLFTHADYDHIIGYRAFDAEHVIASRNFATSDRKQENLNDAERFDTEHEIVRAYPLEYPEPDVVIEGDEQAIPLGALQMIGYLSPGHTEEGLFLFIEQGGVLVAGDYLSDIEFPLVTDISAYRETLAKFRRVILQHPVRFLVPGHGTVTNDVQEMLRRIGQAEEYLDDLQKFSEGIPFDEKPYKKRYPAWQSLYRWHEENLLMALRGMHDAG